MTRFQFRDYGFFLCLLFVAMALMILPVTHSFLLWQPNWVLVVMVFWLSVAPQSLGVFSLWCIGLFQDLLLAEPLGMTAMSYVVVGFFVSRIASRITQYSGVQRGLLMFVLAFSLVVTQRVIWSCLGKGGGFWILIPSVISTTLIGPSIYGVLYFMWQRRLKVY
jgi:rod shape-determining protein MreD